MATQQDGRDRFRSRLLPMTLQHASQIGFYHDHWRVGRIVPSALTDLPTVSKRRHLAELENMRHSAVGPTLLLHTSGTTGRPFLRYRSRQELDAYYEYVSALLAKAGRMDSPVRPVLSFNSLPVAVHGGVLSAPQLTHRVTIDLLSDGGVLDAISLMSDSSLFTAGTQRPWRVLAGPPESLLALILACGSTGVDPASLHLDELCSIGFALTDRIRRTLASSWPAAKISDVFSCSEIIGAAPRCDGCSGYHFEPIVWPEILDLDADRPAGAGIGELAVTELFPFSPIQPLVRYRTGDVVEPVTCGIQPHELGFRPVGRREECPTVSVSGKTTVVMTAADLRDVLDGECAVARGAAWGSTHHVVRRIPLGLPKATWTVTGPPKVCLDVTVEALFSPTLYPVEANRLAERLRRNLQRRTRADDVEVTVRVTEPGTNVYGFGPAQ